MTVRAILLRETVIYMFINVAVVIAAFLLVVGLRDLIPGSRFGRDLPSPGLFVALMVTFIAWLLIRRGSDAAIAPVVPRSVILAAASLLPAGGSAGLVLSQIATIAAATGLAIKIAVAATLSAIVTPYAVHRA